MEIYLSCDYFSTECRLVENIDLSKEGWKIKILDVVFFNKEKLSPKTHYYIKSSLVLNEFGKSLQAPYLRTFYCDSDKKISLNETVEWTSITHLDRRFSLFFMKYFLCTDKKSKHFNKYISTIVDESELPPFIIRISFHK